jgi:hypothetical protein
MEAKREESVWPATERDNAERAPLTTDPILLQVLIDIRASLQRLENRLISDPPLRGQHQIADNSPTAGKVAPEIGDEGLDRSHQTGDQVLTEELVQNADKVGREENANVHEIAQSEPSNQNNIHGAEQVCRLYHSLRAEC